MTKQQTVIYKTLHKKTPNIKQKLKSAVKSGTVPAPLVAHVMLLFFLNVVFWKFIKSFVSFVITFVEWYWVCGNRDNGLRCECLLFKAKIGDLSWMSILLWSVFLVHDIGVTKIMSTLLTNMILSCGVTSSNTIANFVTTYPKHVKALKQTLASNVKWILLIFVVID